MQTTIPSSRDGWSSVAGQWAPSSSGRPITDGRKTSSSSSSYDDRWSRAGGYGSRPGVGTCRLLRSMFKTPVLEVNPLIALSFPRLDHLTTLFRNRVPSGGAGLEDASRSVEWGSSSPEHTHYESIDCPIVPTTRPFNHAFPERSSSFTACKQHYQPSLLPLSQE